MFLKRLKSFGLHGNDLSDDDKHVCMSLGCIFVCLLLSKVNGDETLFRIFVWKTRARLSKDTVSQQQNKCRKESKYSI